MSRGFNWFRDCEVYLADEFYHEYNLKFIGGDSTSHSCGNIIKVQSLLEKYGGVSIPYIDTYNVSNKPELIEPSMMVSACNKVLQTSEVDEVDMRDRIEWFKKLSEQGYYICYDWY